MGFVFNLLLETTTISIMHMICRSLFRMRLQIHTHRKLISHAYKVHVIGYWEEDEFESDQLIVIRDS